MILSPFFTALCRRYERRLYRWFRRHVCWPQHGSQDNSRRPPLRLEREDVHWGKRRRCGGQRRSASGRAVVPHIQALISIPAAAQTHTLTHTRTSTRTHLGYNRPVRRAEIWSDLIYVHDLQLVVSWRFYKQDSSLSLLPCLRHLD